MRIFFSIAFALFTQLIWAQQFQIKNIKTDVNSSFRGLSIVNEHVAWVSGSNGWVGITTDGGIHWNFNQVKGYETAGFRSLYGFDEHSAIIANAGSPANILITKNAGKTWKVVYTNNHEAAFFDGIDFWNKNEGLIYGDPINNKMLLLKTKDGGNTWSEVANSPQLHENEASFAASGTGIRCLAKGKAIISTGGKVSRLWKTVDSGETWSTLSPPIVQGETATGIYSFAVNNKTIILVGGDYTRPELTIKHNLYSNDNGVTWNTPTESSRGYRECVEFITKNILLTTGPTGTDISYDQGASWKSFSDTQGFHVIRRAKKGALTIIAGSNGQIGIIDKIK
ncbi:MAG: YCF48-related protein [Cyclobacteriaceae bacterium]